MPHSQSFTANAAGRLRALMTTAHVCEAFNPLSPPSPLPTMTEFPAIWDTGATNSVITQKVVDTCGLKPVGMAKVDTADSESTCEVYLVNVGLPNGVGFTYIRATKMKLKGSDMLIGMDIIGHGDFAITNLDGKTTFTFRCPSIERIDFCRRPHPPSGAPHVGRNEPCPCGAIDATTGKRKKYKKCHGGINPPA